MERLQFTYSYEFEKNPHPGLFVVLEGLDGSGKETQTNNLINYLKTAKGTVVVMREPTNGPFGAPIRHALGRGLQVDNRTLQMGFSTDRSDDLANGRIITALVNGETVVSERYLFSTLAYGYGCGLDVDWLQALQSKFILPDLTFFLDVPPEICIERITKNRFNFELYEDRLLLEKVYEGYKLLMKRFPGAIIRVDGTKSEGEITEEIFSIVTSSHKFAV